MDFITKIIPKSQNYVIEEANNLIEQTNIKQKIFNKASDYAQKVFQDLTNPNNSNKLVKSNHLQIDNESEMVKFCLILDFLQSIGCKLTPSVFLNETQMTNNFFDRQYLEEKLKLRTYDKTPMLVQLIEEIRTYMNRDI